MPLPGDYNHDLIVDAADYVVWRDQFGSDGHRLAADGNGDNMVTQLDYDVWKANFGIMCRRQPLHVQYAPVPEPSMFAVAFVGAAFANDLSRRSRLVGGAVKASR